MNLLWVVCIKKQEQVHVWSVWDREHIRCFRVGLFHSFRLGKSPYTTTTNKFSPDWSNTHLFLLYMLFHKTSTQWKHLRGFVLDPIDATCWVSWGEGIKTPYSTGSSWRSLSIVYFHSLLLPFLFIGLFLLLVLVSPGVKPVLFVLDLYMKYTAVWFL